jgi:FecR protein
MRHLLLLLLPAVVFAATTRYARLAETTGVVEVQLTAASDWIAAERNLPLGESTWIRTGAASRAEIQFDDNSVLRLGSETRLGLADQTRLATGQRITLISVERGLAYLSGAPDARDSLAVAVPGSQITVAGSARIRVDVGERSSEISILGGAVRFSSPAAELQLRAGQFARVDPADPARFYLDREIPPNELDQWAAGGGDARFGRADLDSAGDWIETADLGRIWHPKAAEGWRPFQSGRWRWYDGLGYTWTAAEAWGWLPYHYGRWTRLDRLGWVWVPSNTGVFKPGDAYWLRSEEEGYIGWGPLAPGEQWPAADPINKLPQEFLAAYTTYAAFEAGAGVIDPEGFERPKDPLAGTVVEASPPSPPFLSGKLEAVRPLVASPHARVNPVVEGTTYETAVVTDVRAARPAPPTVVVVTQPPPAPLSLPPAPEPEVVGVPVFYPVVVGTVSPQTAPSGKPRSAPATPPKSAAAPPFQPGRKRFHNAVENGLYGLTVKQLEGRDYAKALETLKGWSDRFNDTEYLAERRYFYMLAYNGLNQPVKVMEYAGALFRNEIRDAFDDRLQALSASYLAVTNLAKLAHPTHEQLDAARSAAREMLVLVPECLAAADWAKARTELEAEARQVLGRR